MNNVKTNEHRIQESIAYYVFNEDVGSSDNNGFQQVPNKASNIQQ
jgi:hypothetical protein